MNSEGEYPVNDILNKLQSSRLEYSELSNVTQTIYFAHDLEDIKLIELDNNIANLLEGGKSVEFKGRENDKIVLCTNNETYEVKEAQLSNSLLIIPNLNNIKHQNKQNTLENSEMIQEKREVVAVRHNYYELRKTKPRLKRLRQMLEKKPFKGYELEPDTYNVENGFYTLKDLLENVQASTEEISNELKSLEAFPIKGFWRVMDMDYHHRVLSQILNTIEANSWKLDEINLGELKNDLSEILSNEILGYLIEIYLSLSENLNDDGEELFKLNETSVCRFFGIFLLKNVHKFNLKDFVTAWQDCVPQGMTVDFDQLKEMALIDDDSKPATIEFFPEYRLDEDAKKRFQELFAKKPLWKLKQIAPYVNRLINDKYLDTIDTLLMEFTKSFMSNGTRLYQSRFPYY